MTTIVAKYLALFSKTEFPQTNMMI